MKKMNNKGFSLVELIIVIAIMAILAGALAPALLRYIEKTRVSNDKSTAANLKMAVETALADEEVMDEVSANYTADATTGQTWVFFEVKASNFSATTTSADYSDYDGYVASQGSKLSDEIEKTLPSKKLAIKSKKDLNKSFFVAIALGGANQADVVEVYLQEKGGDLIDTQGKRLSSSPQITDLI